MDTNKISDFLWYSYQEGMAHWPVWLVCGIVGIVAIGIVAVAIQKALDYS